MRFRSARVRCPVMPDTVGVAGLVDEYTEMQAELSKLPAKSSVFALGWGEIEGWNRENNEQM